MGRLTESTSEIYLSATSLFFCALVFASLIASPNTITNLYTSWKLLYKCTGARRSTFGFRWSSCGNQMKYKIGTIVLQNKRYCKISLCLLSDLIARINGFELLSSTSIHILYEFKNKCFLSLFGEKCAYDNPSLLKSLEYFGDRNGEHSRQLAAPLCRVCRCDEFHIRGGMMNRPFNILVCKKKRKKSKMKIVQLFPQMHRHILK